MTKIPIGLQLYSVRDDAAKDLSGVLAAVAKMGYDGVEFAGYHGHAPQDIRKLLDDNGLKCFGTHTHLDLLLPEKFDSTVETHKTLGTEFAIVPGLPGEYTGSKDAWLRTAALMNEIAAKLKPLGLQTGYHNHHTEFLPLDGELPWDIFFGNTTDDVIMQFDTGNARHGNAEAGPFLRKYPGRALTVHLKEFSPGDRAVIGDGEVNWPEIFELCESVGGTRYYIVEQEGYSAPPMECVAQCLQNLRKMGK